MSTSLQQNVNEGKLGAATLSGAGSWLWFIYAVLLSLWISHQSLWTDEAFSAYEASQPSLRALWNSLYIGDSSDLQTAIYYLYLHFWTLLFSHSEYALRSANVPFIFLFAISFSRMTRALFPGSPVWLIAALQPFVVYYAGEARAYFILVSLSTVTIGSLLSAFRPGLTRTRQQLWLWLALAAFAAGAAMHMLMFLLLPSLLVLLRAEGRNQIRPFLKPSAFVLANVFSMSVLAVYYGWTFARGSHYLYAKPNMLSMASVLFAFAGLSSYGPNRQYPEPFDPYRWQMMAAGLALLGALLLLARSAAAWSRRDEARFRLCMALAGALAVGLVFVVGLSFASGQQIEIRHMAALVPLLLYLIVACSPPPDRSGHAPRWAAIGLGALTVIWGVADFRARWLSNYQREDFRSAVAKAIQIAKPERGSVALVADPVGGAYYGMAMKGPRPCFPLSTDCQTALNNLTWPELYPAENAVDWRRGQIEAWLIENARKRQPSIVILSLSRHPMYSESPWWAVLREDKFQTRMQERGFEIAVTR